MHRNAQLRSYVKVIIPHQIPLGSFFKQCFMSLVEKSSIHVLCNLYKYIYVHIYIYISIFKELNLVCMVCSHAILYKQSGHLLSTILFALFGEIARRRVMTEIGIYSHNVSIIKIS